MSVTLHTTHGDLKIEVFCESVPKTAEVCCHRPHSPPSPSCSFSPAKPPTNTLPHTQNFLALCASSYYDASPFHRIIPSFMAQTGAPAHPSPPDNPKGGRSIHGGTFDDEIRPGLKHHERGILSMANKGPNTNGSQFFVTFAPAPHLDGLNTVFGRLLGDESLATLARIEGVEVDKKSRPLEEVRIERVTVHANPLAT